MEWLCNNMLPSFALQIELLALIDIDAGNVLSELEELSEVMYGMLGGYSKPLQITFPAAAEWLGAQFWDANSFFASLLLLQRAPSISVGIFVCWFLASFLV